MAYKEIKRREKKIFSLLGQDGKHTRLQPVLPATDRHEEDERYPTSNAVFMSRVSSSTSTIRAVGDEIRRTLFGETHGLPVAGFLGVDSLWDGSFFSFRQLGPTGFNTLNRTGRDGKETSGCRKHYEVFVSALQSITDAIWRISSGYREPAVLTTAAFSWRAAPRERGWDRRARCRRASKTRLKVLGGFSQKARIRYTICAK